MPLEANRRGTETPAQGISHQLGQCMLLLLDHSPNQFLIDHSFGVLAQMLNLPEETSRSELMYGALTIVTRDLGVEEEIAQKIQKIASRADSGK